MPNVDNLNISMSANANKAITSLDTLIVKFDRLSSSVSKLNNSNLGGFSNNVQKLAGAMNSMKSVTLPDFTRLANGIKKFESINPSTINSAAGAVNLLGKAVSNFSGGAIANSSAQITDLAKAIAQLGYKSSTKAIENIPLISSAMKDLMTNLSTVPKVSQNLIDMTNALAKLARTGSSSGKAASSLGKSLDYFSKSSSTAKVKAFSLASAIGKLYASYWMIFRAFGKIKDAIDISSQLTEVQNVVNTTFGKYSGALEKLSENSITDFGISELSVKKTASTFQAMGTAMGFTQGKMADMSVELTKLSADMASFYNVSQEDVAEDLNSVFTGMTRPLRAYGLDLTEATLKEWALKNGMDADIKSMSYAEKTMLRYNYVLANTGAAQGDFLRTQNTWANQTRILSENLKALGSVIGGTFINMLKPAVTALNAVIAKLTQFAEAVSNSLGKIFGWQYEDGTGGVASDFEDAADSSAGIADSTGAAADNIKKMKAGLRAFDELKTINLGDKSSGGSGGSGGGASGGTASGSSGGQWTKVDSIFKDYESSLDNLYKLGDYIGTTLTNTLNNIDWDSIYKGAENFGTGLASFLNGLISPELFGAVGKTIAGALNTAIKASLSFAENFDFVNFGNSIAAGINGFFKEFDASSLATSISTWIKGGLTTVSTMIKQTDFELIGQKIGEFLGSLDTKGMIASVTNIIQDAIEGGIKAIKSTFDVAPVETALIAAFALLKFTGLGSSIATKISQTIASSLASTIGVEIAADAGIGTALKTAIGTIAGGITPASLVSKLSGFAGSIFTALGTALSTVASGFATVLTSLVSGLTGAIGSVGTAIAAFASTFVGQVFIGIAAAFAVIKLVQWLYENTPFGTWVDDVGSYLSDLFKKGIDKITGIGEALINKITSAWSGVKTWWSENVKLPQINVPTIGDIKTALSNKWNEAKTWWNSKPALKSISTTVQSIKDKLSTAWTTAKNWWKKNISLPTLKLNLKISTDSIKKALNTMIGWINKYIIGQLNKISLKIPKIEIAGHTLFGGKTIGFNIAKIPKFEQGGFPEDGWFRASHGEMLGKFDNGQSVVANNKQITEGISAAVYQGNKENNALLRQEIQLMQRQNDLLLGILEKETGISEDALFNSVRKSASTYRKRTGNPAFV